MRGKTQEKREPSRNCSAGGTAGEEVRLDAKRKSPLWVWERDGDEGLYMRKRGLLVARGQSGRCGSFLDKNLDYRRKGEKGN